MGSGKMLNQTEMQTIKKMRQDGHSVNKIAKLLNRSRTVVSNYLKDPNYGKRYVPGRKYSLTPADRQSLLREASTAAATAREIAISAGISNVDKKLRSCQRVLAEEERVQRKRWKRTFTMNQRQLLLISSSRVHGFKYLEHTKDQINNLLQKKNVRTVLFVPYALKDYDEYTKTVGNALGEWGYNVEGLHTKPNPIDAVKSAQAIFIGGGNTFILLKTLYEKNVVEIIRERVLENGIPYIGSSAGTNVATRSIHTTNDMPVEHPPTFDALKLVPFNINPHYLETDPETKHKGETRDERINEVIEYHNVPVLGLREGTSLVVDGDKAVLMGDRNAKLFKANKEQVEYPPQSDLSFLLEN